MCPDLVLAEKFIGWGVNFACVAIDVVMLANGLRKAALLHK